MVTLSSIYIYLRPWRPIDMKDVALNKKFNYIRKVNIWRNERVETLEVTNWIFEIGSPTNRNVFEFLWNKYNKVFVESPQLYIPGMSSTAFKNHSPENGRRCIEQSPEANDLRVLKINSFSWVIGFSLRNSLQLSGDKQCSL